MKEKVFEAILFLENIRSTHNVGSLFRTADTLGIKKIILAGVTPDPIDRFGRARSDIAKTALGAEKTISWEHADDAIETLTKLKQTHALVALEQDPRSIDYKTFVPEKPTVFILGNEVDGVSAAILDLCDTILEIPLLGQKESLNVSVAGAVALFRILDK
jgi:tRNA G18 (ribose-2'-O)-methylase SpoU